MEQAKIYPLNGKDTAKLMQFPDASGAWERTSVFGNLDGCVSDVSSPSGANAAAPLKS